MITPSFSPTATERVLPKLALDFTTATLDSRVTFTRTTDATHPATYVNSSGYVTAATNNQPRFDYDPVALTCKGLLIEESRANLMTSSEDFSSWTLNGAGVSVQTNQITSPANDLTADKVTWSTTGPYQSFKQSCTVANDSNSSTVSIFVKAGTINRIFLKIEFSGGTLVSGDLTLQLSNMTIQGTPSFTSYSVTNFGNGWYRVSGTKANNSSGNTTLTMSVLQYVNDTGYAYFWGAQVEVGAFPTSYIPTTSAALTRNADVATMTGTNFSSWFNATQGSFVATSIPSEPGVAGVLKGIVTVSDGTESNTIRLAYRGAGTFAYQSITSGSTLVNDSPSPAWTTGTTYKMCGAYKLDNYASAVNGNTNTLDTSATVPTVDRCTLGALGSNIQPLNGHLRYLAYYPQRLTNAEVQAFSK